jgi:FixJ family two-component response regulator
MFSMPDLRPEGSEGLGAPVLGTPLGKVPVRNAQDLMHQFLCDERAAGPVSKCDARVIAVVDDDEGFRDALHLFLRTFGFQVEAFASGKEFLRSRRLEAVGCVILDLAMSEMNGLEVQRQVAQRGLEIPIVFLTAHRDDYLGRCARATGALAVLRKPADDEELVRLVREALGAQ